MDISKTHLSQTLGQSFNNNPFSLLKNSFYFGNINLKRKEASKNPCGVLSIAH